VQLIFGRKFDGKVVIALDGQAFVGHSVRVLRSQHSGDYVLFSTAIHTQQSLTADRCMPLGGLRRYSHVRSLAPSWNPAPFNLS
jgi:hypothetical protein